MAIKMDGHTITALQLKASDGSEVTKQLTEEGTIPTPTESLSITANGTYDVTDKASAIVNVPAPEINLQNKTATANGEVTADEGYDGLGVVTVAVSGDTPTYQEKTATQNGVVLPDEGYDALSKVTVNVPAPVLPTLTNPAFASDILSGKEALDGDGVKLTGTCTFDADTSDADAVASDIAEGKTAYVNGAKVVGTASGGGGLAIPTNGARATTRVVTFETTTTGTGATINTDLGVTATNWAAYLNEPPTTAQQMVFANIRGGFLRYGTTPLSKPTLDVKEMSSQFDCNYQAGTTYTVIEFD